MTTNTTNSQAASIASDHELARLILRWRKISQETPWHEETAAWNAICHHIDTKLAQAQADADLRYKELAELHERTLDKLQESESRLAEIQRGVEGLTRRDEYHAMAGTYMRVKEKGDYVYFDDVLALLQPQGQADTK